MAVSSDFLYPLKLWLSLLFYFLVQRLACYFYCSWFRCRFISITELRWWRNDVFFICLNRLSHTLSFTNCCSILVILSSCFNRRWVDLDFVDFFKPFFCIILLVEIFFYISIKPHLFKPICEICWLKEILRQLHVND